jgi:hypothetical protein
MYLTNEVSSDDFCAMYHYLKFAPPRATYTSRGWQKITGTLFQVASLLEGKVVNWEDRLDPANHDPLFPTRVTTIVDVFPIRVGVGKHPRRNRVLHQPYYKSAVYKQQIIITLRGEIVGYSLMHAGVRDDSRIMREYALAFAPQEVCLADGKYAGVPHCLVPHPRSQLDTPAHRADNAIIQHVRACMEHVIGFVGRYDFLAQRKNRNSARKIWAVLVVAMEISALYLKTYPRYPGYGDWAHW